MTKQDDEEKQNAHDVDGDRRDRPFHRRIDGSQHAWHARKSKRDCADRHEQPVTNRADKLAHLLGDFRPRLKAGAERIAN
jgi:hypothetical protein